MGRTGFWRFIPLDDASTVHSRGGVEVDGRLYSASELREACAPVVQTMMDIEREYAKSAVMAHELKCCGRPMVQSAFNHLNYFCSRCKATKHVTKETAEAIKAKALTQSADQSAAI
jgi:hypothetical protein